MTALFKDIDTPTRLEVSNLAMSRGDNVLFEGLSARVSSGDVLWIHGNNGIGKTTLLKSLAGLSRPDAGNVSWYRADHQLSPQDLVAYQPHKPFAKANLTSEEDLSFWAKLYQNSDLVDSSLGYVGLTAQRDVPTQSLSAGQGRRLALAKMILSGKPIWIMDEPAAAMDERGTELIDNLVTHHIKRGGSAIIASHDSTRKLSFNTRKLTLKTAS